MNTPTTEETIFASLLEDFRVIQQPRPDFTLERFVVGSHDFHPAQAWAQCVLEMQVKYFAIKGARLNRRKIELQREQLAASSDAIDLLDAEQKTLDIEQQDLAELGALREFWTLYRIYQSFEKRYTREELNAAQHEYWVNRLVTEGRHQIAETGHVRAGHLEAMRQTGMAPPYQAAEIGDVQQRFIAGAPSEVEAVQSRYLAEGKCRVLIVVATKDKPEDECLPVLEGLHVPGTVEYRKHCIYGLSIDQAYTEAALLAMREGCTHLLTVEDDTFPSADALTKLLAAKTDVVCGWYPKRQAIREGAPIIIKDGIRQHLNDPDGSLVEVYTTPMGCTLFDMRVFQRVPMPWFVRTSQLTQDSFFSQKTREAGFTLWCDTSIRCRHVDRVTGEVYI